MTAYEGERERGARALVERLFEAYNTRDPAAAAALYAERGTHTETAHQRQVAGREAVQQGLERFFAMFPGARWEVLRLIVDGSEAAVSYRLTGSLRGQMGPMQGAGQMLDLRGVLLITTDSEVILATEDYWDAQTFLRQMQA